MFYIPTSPVGCTLPYVLARRHRYAFSRSQGWNGAFPERTRLPASYVRIVYAWTHTEIELALRRQLDQLLLRRGRTPPRRESSVLFPYRGLLIYLRPDTSTPEKLLASRWFYQHQRLSFKVLLLSVFVQVGLGKILLLILFVYSLEFLDFVDS